MRDFNQILNWVTRTGRTIVSRKLSEKKTNFSGFHSKIALKMENFLLFYTAGKVKQSSFGIHRVCKDYFKISSAKLC